MKRLMKKFEDIMIAITFAEAGEFETSMEMMSDGEGSSDAEEEVAETLSEPETA